MDGLSRLGGYSLSKILYPTWPYSIIKFEISNLISNLMGVSLVIVKLIRIGQVKWVQQDGEHPYLACHQKKKKANSAHINKLIIYFISTQLELIINKILLINKHLILRHNNLIKL